MRRLLYIIQKEFIQIFRNKAILPIMTILPIVQMIVLSFAASNEVKNVKIAVVDHDRNGYSRLLIQKIKNTEQFNLIDFPESIHHADQLMQDGAADIVLVIPPDFETEYYKNKGGHLQLLVNAINGQQATIGAGYLNQIIGSFNSELMFDVIPEIILQPIKPIAQINIETAYWYNPKLNYKHFMIPGILGELVTIIIMLLTAMNIVREREVGTIEQINVTPIKKWQFILGKLIPFLLIGLMLMVVGLTVGKLLFDVPLRGNLFVVFVYCAINLSAVLGLGLFISNLSDTQQQAMFTTFFFGIIFILMSGLFTPIESMPKWAQYLTIPNPIAHFVNVMRSVLLKGSGFLDILYNIKVTVILAVIFNTLAIMSYRKVT